MRSGPWAVLAVILGCSGGGAAAPQFNEIERAALDRLFADIKRASRESFETGDWSIMARIYPAAMFSCWDTPDAEPRYAFLSIEGIPETAQYEVQSLDDYMFGDMDTAQMGGTHFMSIRYRKSYPSVCEAPTAQRFPEHHYYLKKQGQTFELVHPCPSKQNAVASWPLISAVTAQRITSAMGAAERDQLRELVRRDQFALNAITTIEGRYQISYNEASLVLDRICQAPAP